MLFEMTRTSDQPRAHSQIIKKNTFLGKKSQLGENLIGLISVFECFFPVAAFKEAFDIHRTNMANWIRLWRYQMHIDYLDKYHRIQKAGYKSERFCWKGFFGGVKLI